MPIKQIHKQHFQICFLLFTENWNFGIPCQLSPKETSCTNCQTLFSGENKKINISLLSDNFAQIVLKVKMAWLSWRDFKMNTTACDYQCFRIDLISLYWLRNGQRSLYIWKHMKTDLTILPCDFVCSIDLQMLFFIKFLRSSYNDREMNSIFCVYLCLWILSMCKHRQIKPEELYVKFVSESPAFTLYITVCLDIRVLDLYVKTCV